MDPTETEDEPLDLEGFEAEDEQPDDAPEPDSDEAPEDAPSDNATIRRMRARIRELERQTKDADEQAKAAKRVDPGPKPRMDDPDVDYDEDKFAEKVIRWNADVAAASSKPETNDFTADWDTSLGEFQTARQALTAADPNAEDIILDVDRAFNPAQTATLIQALGNRAPAMMVKIGNDPDLMDRLADITNPIRFAAEVVRLEASTMTRPKPAVDRPVSGGKAPTDTGRTLARLEAEAERTGDRTKLIRFRRDQAKRKQA